MNIPDAVAALRALGALPEARRRYLSMLAANAPSDSDRARLVFAARDEERKVRRNLEDVMRAEYAARQGWASRNAEMPAEGAQKPSQRIVRTDDTTPEHRPVTVRLVEPTKMAKLKLVRREGIGVNRVYDEPDPVPTERYAARTHGIVATYNCGCRCDECAEASRLNGREYRARKRRANSGKFGH